MRRSVVRIVGGGLIAAVMAIGFLGISLPRKVQTDQGVIVSCPPGTHVESWLGIALCVPDWW